MLGKRLRPTVPGRLVLGLVSVLALLALAPAFAAAQATDATGVQYSDAPPIPTGNKKPKGNTQADKSDSGGQGAQTGVGSGGSGGDSSGGSSEGGANAPAGKGDKGQGSPGSGSGNKQSKALQPGDPAAATTSSEDDGGSSPLVPILIAILVLAAVTVAVVMIRQRRQGADSDDSGAPVSPETN